MNTNLKLLAKQAKERLRTAGEMSSVQTQALSANNSYMVVANIRAIEDDPIYPKVRKILEKSEEEIVINPINQLINKKYYATLSDAEKEKYVLKLVKKYNNIKDYLIKNSLLNSKVE